MLLVAATLYGCERQGPLETGQSPSEPREPAAQSAAIDLAEGPVAMFERACSRCHGRGGSSFGESLKKLSGAGLREKVEEMEKGPAQLEPVPLRVDAMAAYVGSLRDRRPFICVTNGAAFASGKEKDLRGEMTPGTSVVLEKGSTKLTASVDQQVWTITSAPQPPFVLKAHSGNAEAKIDFPARTWSE